MTALRKEMKDKRTWSCQYCMTLALGFCKHEDALPYLNELASADHEATILYSSLGDSIFRLSLISNSTDEALNTIYEFDNFKIMAGALKALAMLKVVPNDDNITRIIELARDPRAVIEVRGHPLDVTGFRKWVATASAGWKDELKIDFLKECLEFNDQHLTLAAKSALAGKYEKWMPY